MGSFPTDPLHLHAEIHNLLKQILGTQVQIEAQHILVHKDEYVVLRMRLRHPTLDVVLKIAGTTPMDTRFEQSAFLHRLLATETTLPVGEVIAADSRGLTWPWRYLLRAHIAGTEFGRVWAHLAEADRVRVYAQIGDAVAQIHGIKFARFGEFSTMGTVEGSVRYLDALRVRVARTVHTHHLAAAFLALIDRHAGLFAEVEQAALCHEDLHKHNVLLQCEQGRWQLASVLDFDKAWAGNPESDLARMEFWDGMTNADFWHGYKQVRTLSPEYIARRPFYQLLWCLEYAKPTARHVADTNRLCASLGLPAVANFG